MRIDGRTLTFKALCALHEVAQQAAREPIKPSFMLRFLLAYLYAVGDAPLWLPRQIWRDLLQPDQLNMRGDMARYARTTAARTGFQAMARHCGYPDTPQMQRDFDAYMNRHGTDEQRSRQLMADAVREVEAERRAIRDKRHQR